MPNPSPFSRSIGSERVDGMRESVIREMTREAHRHDAINLSQGIPDEDETPPQVKRAAKDAIDTSSQYTITWGLPELREAISERYADWKGVAYDPETAVTVTTGTSEAVVSTLLALCNPGDGVIYFEPTYESYIPAVQFAGGRLIPLDITDNLEIDPDELRDAAKDASILILNHPHNPTGNVFTPSELERIADVAAEEDLIVVTDEIYEHIVYTDDYVSPVEVGDLAERTVVCTGMSKTYSVTGWRVGFALAPEPLSAELRKVHDYTSICAPTPFQKAGVEALALPEEYYADLASSYERRRDMLYDGLRTVGLEPVKPDGAYYMLTRYPKDVDDTEFALQLIREAGVAVVPGSSFYTEGTADWVRFTFSRNEETIEEALYRLDENRFW
ncbi:MULTISPECIES: pyridoxal phosphate-dependent aminotransferase [Haloferax]|uniref:Aminotransferase n=1 Tax=Haloferax marinum TaxID=2666143 RepID=A0A6A8GAR6_9EURY|nr:MULTISPECIES: pyridoxal phosphate-dependent aminotransferase [Haloferax]KAB1190761.1 pyridoxal phosphate-dependent aminotransferase [Haloferax sp. CBA1150]MRW98300.1 aminotransferase class I/II-fold pyridoxal phosphate-dependent enzyme [Haloferax marinum]